MWRFAHTRCSLRSMATRKDSTSGSEASAALVRRTSADVGRGTQSPNSWGARRRPGDPVGVRAGARVRATIVTAHGRATACSSAARRSRPRERRRRSRRRSGHRGAPGRGRPGDRRRRRHGRQGRPAGAFEARWGTLPGRERAKYLFRIARLLQERSREFAVLESMDSGKPIKESRDVDVPLAAAHFWYYAGWADKLEYAFPGRVAAAARRRRARSSRGTSRC